MRCRVHRPDRASRWQAVGLLIVCAISTVACHSSSTASHTLGPHESERSTETSASDVQQFNCQGPIESSDALPDGFESIGDSVALQTSTSELTAFGLAQMSPADPPFRLASKNLLVIRADVEAELVVPGRWIGKFAFQWNSPRHTNNLRIGPCVSQSEWLTFPGGYRVAEPGCFDFIVRTSNGDRSISVGVGQPCPGQMPPVEFTES